jgi:D-lactate dehydrogenase
MKVAFFSTKPYDQKLFETTNQEFGHDLVFFEPRLTPATAALAEGFPTVCVFINDDLGETTLHTIASGGTRLITLRCSVLSALAKLALKPFKSIDSSYAESGLDQF